MIRRFLDSIREKKAEYDARKVMKEFIDSAEGRHVVFKTGDGRIIWEYRNDEEGKPRVYAGEAYNDPTEDSEILFLEKSGEIFEDPRTKDRGYFTGREGKGERK